MRKDLRRRAAAVRMFYKRIGGKVQSVDMEHCGGIYDDGRSEKRRVEKIQSSSRSAIGGKKPLNGTPEPGEHVTSVEVVRRSQNFDMLGRPIDVDHPGFGFHKPDQTGS